MRKRIEREDTVTGDIAVGNGLQFRLGFHSAPRSSDGLGCYTNSTWLTVTTLEALGFTFEREMRLPTGLGAVVESRAGNHYVQVGIGPNHIWFSTSDCTLCDGVFGDFTVLSEGVKV